MTKKKEGISEDYRIEIEQALEEVIQTPVGSDLEAKVLPAEIPDTVEQLLDYARHGSSTEYSPEVKVYETSTKSESTDYWYHSDAEDTTTSSHSATYNFTVQENKVLKSADAQIASAALHNMLGVYDAFTHVNEDTQARIDNFKLLNKAEWYFMYEASSWLVTSI
jgi:hypothetical protein